MSKYNITEIRELFEKHITAFDVADVREDEKGFFIYLKEKMSLASYLQEKCVSYLKFKNGNVIYEAKRFFINIKGSVSMVFVIKKGTEEVDVLSLYEINHYENFTNEYADLVIDEIIKEV